VNQVLLSLQTQLTLGDNFSSHFYTHSQKISLPENDKIENVKAKTSIKANNSPIKLKNAEIVSLIFKSFFKRFTCSSILVLSNNLGIERPLSGPGNIKSANKFTVDLF